MSNLTVSVDDEIIKRARVRAIQQGTSLSAKVREFLQQYVSEPRDDLKKQRAAAADRLMAAIDIATSQTQPAATAPARSRKRRSLREEIYEGDFRAAARPAAKPSEAG